MSETERVPEAYSHWCCTEVQTNKFTFTWSIKNFSLCQQKTGEHLVSSVFYVGEHEWRLLLYPQGEDDAHKDYLALYLELVSSSRSPAVAMMEVSLIDEFQRQMNGLDEEPLFFTEGPRLFTEGAAACGFNQFIKVDEIEEYIDLDDDQLTIVCAVTVIGDTVSDYSHSKPFQFKVPECSLVEELGNLLESNLHSDVVLCVGDQEFKAHKNIISARSRVFRAMFENEMREKESSRVEIRDVDKEVMGELLRFIYTGRAPNLDKMAAKLLVAADKYDLKTLKVMCEEALCSNLLIDTACEILALADRHSADQLKSRAIDFIKGHAAAVMESAGWKDIISSHPHLVSQFVLAMVPGESPPREPPFKRLKQS